MFVICVLLAYFWGSCTRHWKWKRIILISEVFSKNRCHDVAFYWFGNLEQFMTYYVTFGLISVQQPCRNTGKKTTHNPQPMLLFLRYFHALLIAAAMLAVPAAAQTDSTDEYDAETEVTEEPSAIPANMIDTAAMTQQTLPDSSLERLRRDPEFDYSKEIQEGISWWDLFKRTIGDFLDEIFSEAGVQSVWGVAKYVLVAAAFIALMLYLTKTDLRSFFARAAAVAPVFGAISENIHELDLDALLRSALLDEDYRRAVRLHYLLMLKELATAEAIVWRPEKTNRDYRRELQKTAPHVASGFAALTRIFERVRYGNRAVRLPEYTRIAAEFQAFSAAAGANTVRSSSPPQEQPA